MVSYTKIRRRIDLALLHNHTEYSNLRLKDSTNRIEQMVLYAANDLKLKGLAITDHEYIGNHVKAINITKKLKAKGKIPEDFKVILGNEIYLIDEQDMNYRLENKLPIRFYHFILLAKDEIGHLQLQRLSSRAWSRAFTYRRIERVPTFYDDIEEIVDSNPGHLIASTACLGGFLGAKVMEGEYESARNFIGWCQDVFGEENFYLEMQPHRKEYDESGAEVISEQQRVNQWIHKEGYPTIVTTDAHYLREEDREIHKSYLKSDEDEETYSSGGRETDAFYSTCYLMDGEEIMDNLSYLPKNFLMECFANSVDIANRCEEYDLAQKVEIPEIPLPDEWDYDEEVLEFVQQGDWKNINYMLNSDDEYDRYLMSLAFYGIKERNLSKETRWKQTLDRLDQEMYELIGITKAKDTTVSKYFINTHKMIDIFWNDANCMVGPSSRGSAAGWELNYLLQISAQSPLDQPMEMPLWRFISSERPDYP